MITFYNRKAADLWGYRPSINDPSERKYCGSHRIFNRDGSPLPHDQCPMAIALQRQQETGGEIVIERPDGTRVSATAKINPLYKDGQFSGAVNILQEKPGDNGAGSKPEDLAASVEKPPVRVNRDTLPETAAGTNAAELSGEGILSHYTDFRDQFIGMVSHELRTPLTVLKNNLELLGRKVEGPDLKELLSNSVSSIDKLSVLVTELLDISKIEGAGITLDPQPFRIDHLVEECVDTIQQSEPGRTVSVEANLERNSVTADRYRVRQVIFNLLSNAVKYSSDDELIVVKLQSDADHMQISVTDFGLGIPEELQEKVFTRFFREEHFGPSYPGLGIGLFISKDIVERHNGEMWVESELNEGSTFHVRLPFSRGGDVS